MKKLFNSMLLFILASVLLVSCSINKDADTQTDTQNINTQQTTEASEKMPETSGNTGDAVDSTDDKPIGGTDVCKVHDVSYHAFPSTIINLVGENKFHEWIDPLESPSDDGDCRYPEATLYNFIHHFNIPRETMEEIYTTSMTTYYPHVWNLNVLYLDTDDAADEFYRNIDNLFAVQERRSLIRELKLYILYDGHEEAWNEHFGRNYMTPQDSVIEIANAFNISREDLEAYAQKDVDLYNSVYDYDFDMIYNEDGTFKEYDSTKSGLELDAQFCGITDYYIQ